MTREELENLLRHMVDAGASDVFVVAGLPLTYRASGRQIREDTAPLSPDMTESIARAVYDLARRDYTIFEEDHNADDDFSFAVAGIGRFRINVFRQRGSVGAIIRVIPFELPSPEKYGIPESVMRVADFQKGLVLVTGPAGSGKSTTLACMVDRLNHTRDGHIITMEDPIEFVHRHGTCIVTQREVPTDVATYAEALRSAMRESPNVLLIGEIRDPETVSAAVTAAETAQLVFSTLHTTGAANAVDRLIDSYPTQQQHQIRVQLSMALQAVVSQQLIPAKDGTLVAAFEIMIANPAIRNLIRESKTHQMDSIIASNGKLGMKTMDQSLAELVESGIVDRETALQYAVHQDAFIKRLESKVV